ncbi:hypothetical protein A0H81_01150 [Grifola frondosa]|uniref:Uncharacterized protein n=1 Tax=Grifola frondosa TaxID=5627 RepID=A0A1C7MTB4_GRIFR|nr:hypothetical protein A0H81_01150 [Grifola frondosa]
MAFDREIHLSDLIRAHEGNPDYHDDDPNKIHWAKFNMMARFVDAILNARRDAGNLVVTIIQTERIFVNSSSWKKTTS